MQALGQEAPDTVARSGKQICKAFPAADACVSVSKDQHRPFKRAANTCLARYSLRKIIFGLERSPWTNKPTHPGPPNWPSSLLLPLHVL